MATRQNMKMARALAWNADRPELIERMLESKPANWKRISRHDNEQAAYVVQRTLRRRHTDLETKVLRVTGKEWGAEIHARKSREAPEEGD